jgi:hypothetical protein
MSETAKIESADTMDQQGLFKKPDIRNYLVHTYR